MATKSYLVAALMPPVGACRYGCGTNCAAPVGVFWVFGIIGVVFGLMGGPTGEPGISWYTVGLGILMWAIAAVWSMLTLQGLEADRCASARGPRSRHVAADETEPDPFDEIKKAH